MRKLSKGTFKAMSAFSGTCNVDAVLIPLSAQIPKAIKRNDLLIVEFSPPPSYTKLASKRVHKSRYMGVFSGYCFWK